MRSSHTRIKTVYLHVIPLKFKVETEVSIQVHDTAAEITASAVALGWGGSWWNSLLVKVVLS